MVVPSRCPRVRQRWGAAAVPAHLPSLGQGQTEVGAEAAPEARRIGAQGEGDEARGRWWHRRQAKILAAWARASDAFEANGLGACHRTSEQRHPVVAAALVVAGTRAVVEFDDQLRLEQAGESAVEVPGCIVLSESRATACSTA